MARYTRFAEHLLSLDETGRDYAKTSITERKGEELWQLIRERRYETTLEVGCALGISSLYICDAIATRADPSHLAIDPSQTKVWDRLGARNVAAGGYDYFELLEEPSELALPRLLEGNRVFDFAFIDGWHTFDHALVDFFYVNRLLRVGGVVVFDDADTPPIGRLVRYVSNYPAYTPLAPPKSDEPARGLRRVVRNAADAMPDPVRRAVLSPKVLPTRYRRVFSSGLVAFEKVAEDRRRWDWYAPF